MSKALRINGAVHHADLPDEVPLLWVLRDAIGLTGTKYGCGVAACGACTVHIGGTAVRSCQVTLGEVKGEITTIEGLANTDMAVLQQSWIDHQVAQCGYCQSGQLMQAASILSDNPSPSDAEIDSAMNGNLCRCGTYPRIRSAIHDAAEKLARQG